MAKLIESWEGLVGLESDDYYLDIDVERCCGHIVAKEHIKDNEFYLPYLSTHTFYGLNYKESTILLQEYEFDVQLKNWDGETEFVNYREQWLHNGRCDFCRRSKYCNKKCKAALKRMEFSSK